MKAEGSMSNTRKQYSAELKAKIALAAIKGQQTVNEIASDYGVHPTQVSLWKKQLLSEAASLFDSSRSKKSDNTEELQSRLYQEIGQLKVELDWLKKNLGLTVREKLALIKADRCGISLTRQCELLGVARSGLYYKPIPMSRDKVKDALLSYRSSELQGLPKI